MPRLLTAVLALSVPLAAWPQARAFDATRGLVASYPLDGDAAEEVSRQPGQAVGVRPVEGRDGRRPGALWFDGTRSYVNLGDKLDLPRFTISAWVRPDAVDRVQVVISRIRNLPGHYQKNLELRLDAGGRAFLHVPSGAAWEAVQGTRPVVPGRWTHLAATYDGQRATLYVDGVRDGSLDVAYAQTRTGTFLGARPEGGSQDGRPTGPTFFFGGAIDEVRLWGRALSEHELDVVAGRTPAQEPSRGYPGNPGTPPPAPEARPVAQYPLDHAETGDAAGQANGRPSKPLRPAEDRRGQPDGAAAFTGKEFVDLGTAVEPERFSIAAWVRPSRVDRDMVIWSKLSTSNAPFDRWVELRLDRSGKVALSLPGGRGPAPTLLSARALAPSRWVHVAATYDGDRATIYVAGQPDAEGALPPFDASRGASFLAARPEGTGRRGRVGTYLEGRLDDVRLYREALPAAAVAALAERAVPGPGPYPGVPGGWDRDDEEAGSELLVKIGRGLVRFDGAVARRDAGRIAAAEDMMIEALDQAANDLRGDRTAAGLVQRLRRAAQELQQLRGRNDAMSLDRKRGALAALADSLWNDLAQDLDERPIQAGPRGR